MGMRGATLNFPDLCHSGSKPVTFLPVLIFGVNAVRRLGPCEAFPCCTCKDVLDVSIVHIADDVPPGVVWMHDRWVGLNHLTSGDAVLTGDALGLFPFSVGQSDYGAQVD
jgi:hypothetical protein